MEHINLNTIDLTIFKGESFCRAACWFDIITLASEKPATIYWKGTTVKLQRGEFAASVRLLADRWCMTTERTRTRLKEFADGGLIRVAHSAGAIVVTVLPLCHETTVKDDESPTAELDTEPKVSDDRNLNDWFDEISCDKDLRDKLFNEHGIRNWTKLRSVFGELLLSDVQLATRWLNGDDEVRLTILLENASTLAERGSRSAPVEAGELIETSRGLRLKQDGNYIILPTDITPRPSVEHRWNTKRNKWILNRLQNGNTRTIHTIT
jgi:hypothetical protein